MDGARAAHRGTGFGDRLHHDRRFGDAEAGAAVGLGHGDAEPVALGHGVEERVREDGVAVPFQPVGVVEPGANPQDLIADLLLRLGQGEVHGADLSGTDRLSGVIATRRSGRKPSDGRPASGGYGWRTRALMVIRSCRRKTRPSTTPDFYAWANEQAALLRAGRLSEADIENIAEEIESMGRSERRELVSRLTVLLVHLLKWRYQPDLRGRSWHLTIEQQRFRMQDHLADNPSLKSQLDEMMRTAHIGMPGSTPNGKPTCRARPSPPTAPSPSTKR